MSQQQSLADMAVETLAAVSRMTAEVTNDHDERHYIRTLKRLAEATLDQAMRQANELAYLAASIQADARQVREQEAQKKESP